VSTVGPRMLDGIRFFLYFSILSMSCTQPFQKIQLETSGKEINYIKGKESSSFNAKYVFVYDHILNLSDLYFFKKRKYHELLKVF
jgi:hypothetical protein